MTEIPQKLVFFKYNLYLKYKIKMRYEILSFQWFWKIGLTAQICKKKVVRSSHRRCSMKKMFLKISKNSQENNCARVSFLIKDIEKEAVAQVLPMSFEKFLRTPFLQNTSWRLLLQSKIWKVHLKKYQIRYFNFCCWWSSTYWLMFDY